MTDESETRKEVIEWGIKYLSSHCYTFKNNQPENVKDSPWSHVVRFATSNGYIYLKHTPNLLALEATITQKLHDKFHASVPEIIAHNPELGCFLMKDAGRPLRETLKKQFNVELLVKAIEQFTALQVAAEDHVNVFLDIGVPDWRLDKLPDLFIQFLSQKNILIEDGLSEIEVNQLKALLPKVSDLCKKLSGYSVKQTIVQPDFHDNNVLIDDITQKLTLIDLGEIVISHPFFSLLNCLYQVRKHHGLTENDAAYLQLKDACLKHYENIESKTNLLEAFKIARILEFVYGALANYRLMLACDKESLMLYQRGKLSTYLREFLKA